jgi:hypothetical protein
MITLQKGEIYNPAFGNALTSLSKNTLPFETAYNVKRIVRQIKKNLTEFQSEIQEICKPFAVLKDGVPVAAPVFGLVPYDIVEDKKQECSQSLEKFLTEEFSIESNMVSFESLSGITIAPADLLALEKVISEPASAHQSNVVDFPQQPSPVQ